MKELRHHRGALTLETTEARAVFDGDALADLRPDEKNRGQGAHRGLHDRGERRDRAVPRAATASPRCGACCAPPSGGTASSSWPPASASGCPRSRARPRSRQFLARRRQADPARFADVSLSVVKLLGSGEYAVELPGGLGGRTLRPRGAGLHALHRAEPPLPGPRDAAPAQGRDRRDARLRTRRTQLTELARHCTAAGGQRREGGAAGAQVRGGAAARAARRRAVRRDRHRRLAEGDLGAHPPTRPRRGAWCAASRARRGRPVRVELVHTDVERGFIDFARACRPAA